MKNALYFLAVFVAFVGIVKLIFDLRMRKHHGVSRHEFLRAFSDAGIPTEIPAAVYDYYKKGVLFKRFGIAPDDAYEDVLHRGEEDIEDDARFLMRKLGLKPPPAEARRQWNEQIQTSRARSAAPGFSVDSTQLMQPIRTVRDMVLWLGWVRQNQKAATSR